MSATEKYIAKISGIYRRLDAQPDYGRNVTSTYRHLHACWMRLQEALEAGGYEELDERPKLAARFSRIERRQALGAERAPMAARRS